MFLSVTDGLECQQKLSISIGARHVRVRRKTIEYRIYRMDD